MSGKVLHNGMVFEFENEYVTPDGKRIAEIAYVGGTAKFGVELTASNELLASTGDLRVGDEVFHSGKIRNVLEIVRLDTGDLIYRVSGWETYTYRECLHRFTMVQ